MQRALYEGIIPVQFPNEFEHLIDGFLSKNIEYKMTNEKLDWSSFFLNTRWALRGIALDGYSALSVQF